jgi:hypothetical protein
LKLKDSTSKTVLGQLLSKLDQGHYRRT